MSVTTKEQVAFNGRWIHIVDEGSTPSGKTRTFRVETAVDLVDSTDEPVTLGIVRWFGRWRCYAFFPWQETVYEPTCLREIATFCAAQTDRKRTAK